VNERMQTLGRMGKGKPKTLTPDQREQRRRQAQAINARRAAAVPTKWVLSYSGGKDSTALLHLLLRERYPLDAIVTFASEWEFPALDQHLWDVERIAGVTITRIGPSVPWYELRRKWGWPHWRCRWCTGDKGARLDKVTRGCGKYIGICADEAQRAQKYRDGKTQVRWARFPLIDHGITTKDAMRWCRELGYRWQDGTGAPGLYDTFTRFSCYCCPLQGIRSLYNVRLYHPALWRRMIEEGRGEVYKGGRTMEEWDARLLRKSQTCEKVLPAAFRHPPLLATPSDMADYQK